MLNILLYVAVGVFIGWNVPQPTFAKILQAWVLSKWRAFGIKK